MNARPNSQPSPAYARVVKARSDLLVDNGFFGFLALRLTIQEDPSCVGVWTDGKTLGFNPQLVNTLLDLELQGLLCDALMRIVAGHPWRQGSRDPALWNRACSEVTRLLVSDAGLRLPGFMPINPEYRTMSAEYLYAQLLQNQEESSKPPQGASSAPDAAPIESSSNDEADSDKFAPNENEGSMDSQGAGAGPSEPDADPLHSHWVSEVRAAPSGSDEHTQEQWQLALADAVAHDQGSLPGSLKIVVENSLKSRLDWRSILHNFAEASAHSPDYTFSRMNTRYMHMGLMLPGLQGYQMKSMVIVRDTSGSVGEQYRGLFNGEIQDILEKLKPQELIVIDADARIQKVQSLESADYEDFDSTTYGGGGTRVEPAFTYVQDEGIDCSCLIYLTDLQGSFPTQEPDYPVLWVVPEGSNRGMQPPFGELLELELE